MIHVTNVLKAVVDKCPQCSKGRIYICEYTENPRPRLTTVLETRNEKICMVHASRRTVQYKQ
jgi:hypothetical protein